jgi:Copper transport outer membrane protein, MctB
LIDFRYHLVSIVAVFLALAIGIVVGSTALQGSVVTQLDRASQHELRTNRTLYAHNAQLKNQISADEAFAQAAEPSLLHGLLAGERVVLVLAPGADGATVDGVTTALTKAGAAVTGQIVLSQQFFDTGATNEQALKSTATNLAPPGVGLPRSASDPQISGQQAAAQVMAAAIVNKDGLPTLTTGESQQILGGFGNAGFLQINGVNGGATLAGQATMAVVVLPATVPPARISVPFNLALVSLTQDLQEASKGALLAGGLKGSGPHSAIDAVVSGSAGVTLTTVDNAETVMGQIVVAQALRELLNPHASPAAYGVRPGAVPSPAPSPVVTPSASPTPASSKRAK